ncbi:hypothetical protein INT45_008855, partial [Circinella minor]
SHGTASDYQRAPLSPEDNVFATDDIDVGNGEENDDEVVMNAEDIEFGDNDLDNENGTINIDQADTYHGPPPSIIPDVQNYPHPLVLVVIFLVLFQVHFVSEHLSSVIIEFCIILLGDLQPGISIPTSLATLRRITGFSALTDSLRKYVSCSNCHCLFLLSDPNCPTICPNNDIRYPNTCGNSLFRTI